MLLISATWFVFLASLASVLGHGRLMDPPARNSMWRLGFPNPVNYNDNELYCGGRVTQWARNKGKCGICGDPYHSRRDHEVGGKYANGIISREYVQGDVIDVTVHITANHKGYFEFRICPVEDPKVEVTQECLDEHLVELVSGEGTRYLLPEGKSNQFFNVSLRLPRDITCQQCVIQWKYRTGNTWDKDENGKFCVGCGPQEEFYNCADVRIHAKGKKPQLTGLGKAGSQSADGKKTESDDATLTREMFIFGAENDNLKKSVYDTISDQGQLKSDFMKKLESNKYSTWNDPEKSRFKPSVGGGSPFAHLARKNNQVAGDLSRSTLRFGFVNDGSNNLYSAEKPMSVSYQPSSDGYQWKAVVPKSQDVEEIYRRFAYGSVLGREDKGRREHHRRLEDHLHKITSESDVHKGHLYKATQKSNVREGHLYRTTPKSNVREGHLYKTTPKSNAHEGHFYKTTPKSNVREDHLYKKTTVHEDHLYMKTTPKSNVHENHLYKKTSPKSNVHEDHLYKKTTPKSNVHEDHLYMKTTPKSNVHENHLYKKTSPKSNVHEDHLYKKTTPKSNVHEDHLYKKTTPKSNVHEDHLYKKTTPKSNVHEDHLYKKTTPKSNVHEDHLYKKTTPKSNVHEDHLYKKTTPKSNVHEDHLYKKTTPKSNVHEDHLYKKTTPKSNVHEDHLYKKTTPKSNVHENHLYKKTTPKSNVHEDHLYKKTTLKSNVHENNLYKKTTLKSNVHEDHLYKKTTLKSNVHEDNLYKKTTLKSNVHEDHLYKKTTLKSNVHEDHLYKKTTPKSNVHEDHLYKKTTPKSNVHEDHLYKKTTLKSNVHEDHLYKKTTLKSNVHEDHLYKKRTPKSNVHEDHLYKKTTPKSNVHEDHLYKKTTSKSNVHEEHLEKKTPKFDSHEDHLNTKANSGNEPRQHPELQNGKKSTKTGPDSHREQGVSLESQGKNVDEASHKYYLKEARNLHSGLRNMAVNKKVDRKQWGNFLRQWKQMRLRHILALRALNATSKPSVLSSTRENAPQKSQWSTRRNMHSKGHQNINFTKSMSPFSPSPSNLREMVPKRMNVERHLSQNSPSTEPPAAIAQINKQRYVKKQLPSWLANAVKLRNRDSHNKNVFAETHNINSPDKDISSSGADATTGTDNKRENVLIGGSLRDNSSPNPMSRVSGSDMKFDVDTLESSLPRYIKHFGKTGRNDEDALEKMSAASETMLDSTTRMKENDEATERSIRKTKDNGIQEKASLIRYIVNLLLSEKAHDNLNTSTGKPSTKAERPLSNDRLKEPRKLSVLDPDYNASHTWSVPDSAETVPPARESPVNNEQPEAAGENSVSPLEENSSLDVTHLDLVPSVRGDVRPFNGLILGALNDYNRKMTNSSHQRSQAKETGRRYSNADIINLQRQSLRDNQHHNKNNFYHSYSQTNRYLTPNFVQGRHGARVTSMRSVLPKISNDYHHMRSSRAGNRQDYYDKLEPTRRQLICKSLVALSGDMDRWCTDNCNANYCPKSTCVCTVKVPDALSYSGLLGSTMSRTWHQKEAVPDLKLNENAYINYISADDRDGASKDTHNIATFPQRWALNHRNSEMKRRNTMAVAQPTWENQYLLTNNRSTEAEDINLFDLNQIGWLDSRAQEYAWMIQPNEAVDKMGVDFHKSSNVIGRRPDYSSYTHKRRDNHQENYDMSGDLAKNNGYFQPRQTVVTDMKDWGRSLHQYYPSTTFTNKDIWRKDTEKHGPGANRNRPHGVDSTGRKRGSFVKAYVYNQRSQKKGSSMAPTDDGVAIFVTDNRRTATNVDHLSNKQFGPQVWSTERHGRLRESGYALTCKAVGSYAGFKQYDEWCSSACQSANCPLLICSCESRPFYNFLKV